MRYHVEGRTQRGSFSSERAWPAQGPTRSRSRASTRRWRTDSEPCGIVVIGELPLCPQGRLQPRAMPMRHVRGRTNSRRRRFWARAKKPKLPVATWSACRRDRRHSKPRIRQTPAQRLSRARAGWPCRPAHAQDPRSPLTICAPQRDSGCACESSTRRLGTRSNSRTFPVTSVSPAARA